MDEDDTVSALIDRIVAGAQVPSRAVRDDLHRELWTHFEEAGTSPDAVEEAVRRFGAEPMVTESLRRIYRGDYIALYLGKIAASILASLAVALVIQVLVNLRVELQAEVWRLAPGFSHAAGLSVGVVVALATAWEVSRQPFNRTRAAVAIVTYVVVCLLVQLVFANSLRAIAMATVLVIAGYLCSRLERRPAQLLLTLGLFAATQYGSHRLINVTLAPGRAVWAGAVLVAVCASTVMILARFDHAFFNAFHTSHQR